MRTKTIGGTYRFTYPNYGTPNSHPDYTAHSGQKVRVLRQLTDKECSPECQPMWRVVAADGWIGTACSSELRTPGKPKVRKQKKLFVVCRYSQRVIKHPARSSSSYIPIFYAVCSTFDRATYQCDKLTKKFGPTFIIVEAPLDP